MTSSPSTRPRALALSLDTAFGRVAGETLSLLGYDVAPVDGPDHAQVLARRVEADAPSLLMLSPPWIGRGGDVLLESRTFVGEVLSVATDLAPVLARSGRGLVVQPLSLSALPPFGDATDSAHRAALAAAQLCRAWFAPLGVRVATLFVDPLDMATNRADRSAVASLDADALEIGLRHVLSGADEAFCDPAALAVWEAVNGDW